MASADRLIEVFHEARARSAGAERDGFLAEVCQDDAELKTQILSLMQAHDGAGEFLGGRPALAPTIEAELARIRPEKAGERIGRYKLLQEIGEGGFGVVWMAEQMEPVSRRVALKIIKMGMDTQEVIARFEAERQALAMMDHPNIAQVFDAGATQLGRPFFVMELVKGIPITQFCDERQLGTRERLALFGEVCAAINHAHQKGIIHRDIKPSNVMVTLHDDEPVVKVIDFGIAKATQGKLTEKTLLTRFEQFIGTPVYMSPEQASTSGLDIDTRSDIYALGILLYELLTGRPPFDAKSLASAGYEEMRRIIREVEPPKPSSRVGTMVGEERIRVAKTHQTELGKVNRLVEPDLDWIVMKSIEKDRERRYETANGLALDIQRFLADEPVSATPPSTRYQVRRFARRNKTALRVAAGIAALLVAATIVSSWLAVRATRAEELATKRLSEVCAERDAKEAARKEADAVATFMSEVLQGSDPARDGRRATLPESLQAATVKIETELADKPARRARLQAALANTYAALGLHREALPLREKVVAYYKSTSRKDDPETLTAMLNAASSYQEIGNRDKALKLREEVLPLCRQTLGPEHPGTLAAMTSLALSYAQEGRVNEALALREVVATLRQKVLGLEHYETLWAMQSLADSYFSAGRRLEALNLREEVLHLRRKNFGAEHPATLWAMHNLAVSYHAEGRLEEALKLRESVLNVRRRVLGSDSPATLWIMHDLADSYFATGRLEEALKMREEVLALRRVVLGPDHPNTLVTIARLADSYLEAGRVAEATPLLALASRAAPENGNLAMTAAALQVWFGKERDYGLSNELRFKWTPTTGDNEVALRVTAKIACLRPIHDKAMQEATVAFARRAAALVHGKQEVIPWSQMTLGMAEYRSGNYAAADQALTAAMESASATLHYRSLVEGTASFYRAMCFFHLGQQAKARELFCAAQAKMKPLPSSDQNPLADGNSDHDDLILWLAYKEAKGLLNTVPTQP